MGKNIVFAVVPEGKGVGDEFFDRHAGWDDTKAALQLVLVRINDQKLIGELHLTTFLAHDMNDATGGAFYRLLHPNDVGDDCYVVWLAAQQDQLRAFATAAINFVPVNETVDDFRPEGDSTVKRYMIDFAAAAQSLLKKYGLRAVLMVM